ncbi:MAG: hypothetical protein M1814_000980 [Vezdaea aestivalis]|nr:MAG: hypothetical protein M1814_000980 [Vezdaea aestivalis]
MRHPSSLTRTYLLPALLLNPVLVLHSLNTMLAHALPSTTPPTSWIGAPPANAVLDMHASGRVCWSYTLVMVCAQLVAFGRVSAGREERREVERLKREAKANGWGNGERMEVEGKEGEDANGTGSPSSDEGIA